MKFLKACRELHSLQVNNLIVTLYTSSSRQQLPYTQQQHAQQPKAPHAQQHKTRKTKRGNNCNCGRITQTHKIKSLKSCRELQSLQVNNLIAVLCKSSSRQQLSCTQQQHAQEPQAPHAQQHKTRRKKRGNNCNCSRSTQTHKSKFLKAYRELHSLQVNNMIATLHKSESRQQLPHTKQQHAQQPQAPHPKQHKTRREKRGNNCNCSRSTQTHKNKFLKACRELHSLQVNNLIAVLNMSASRQQLPHTQQQHAQQPQATHAQQHKTCREKGETTATAAAASKLTR
jgi:hypothetical protein